MTDFKPLVWEAIMAFDKLEDIEDTFPFGAKEIPGKTKAAPSRWVPAEQDEKPTKTLRALLKAKRERGHITRVPHRDSSRGYAETVYDQTPYGAMDLEPEAPPKEWTDRNADERRIHGEERRETTVADALNRERQALKGQLSARQRLAAERGIAIRSDIRVIEKRLEEIDRRLGLRAA